MAEEKKEPPDKERPEAKELRDLKPKKDVKGGAQKPKGSDARAPGSKGEVDFMGWD